LKNKKVLLADDRLANRVAMGQLFEYFGFDVVQATSGANAVAIYGDDPSFDLVVLSVNMSGMNGFMAAKMIRQQQIAKRPYIIGIGTTAEQFEKSVFYGIDLSVYQQQEPAGGIYAEGKAAF